MQKIPDWAELWRELVEIKRTNQQKSIETPGDTDYWAEQARKYDKRVKTKWAKPDVTRQLVLDILQPDSSIVDIGAGTGAWTLMFADHLQKVTAVEPSKAMRDVLIENIKDCGKTNIEIIPEKWPDAAPVVHDYVFCSHAMYETNDFPRFVQKMMDCASKMCFLLIRAPSLDGLINEACQHIWNQPHDSPNFTIAYNILLQMDLSVNVQFEESDQRHFICSSSEEEALTEIKERMGLLGSTIHDDYLRELLHRRLIKQDDEYLWPGSRRSALIYWKVKK